MMMNVPLQFFARACLLKQIAPTVLMMRATDRLTVMTATACSMLRAHYLGLKLSALIMLMKMVMVPQIAMTAMLLFIQEPQKSVAMESIRIAVEAMSSVKPAVMGSTTMVTERLIAPMLIVYKMMLVLIQT